MNYLPLFIVVTFLTHFDKVQHRNHLFYALLMLEAVVSSLPSISSWIALYCVYICCFRKSCRPVHCHCMLELWYEFSVSFMPFVVAKSRCVSDKPFQWEKGNFNSHSFKNSPPIVSKLIFKKHFRESWFWVHDITHKNCRWAVCAWCVFFYFSIFLVCCWPRVRGLCPLLA